MSETLKCSICNLPPISRATYLSHLMGKKHKKTASQRNLSSDKTFNKRSLQITANGDLKRYEFDILRKYLQYDVVDLEIKRNTAYVEFPSEKIAMTALKDKLEIGGVSLNVGKLKVDRCAGRNKSGFIQTNCDIKAPQISSQLSNYFKSNDSRFHADELILCLVKEIELKQVDYRKRENVRFLVQTFLQQLFPGALTFLFGSSMNGLGFKGCDVDMVADLRQDIWRGLNKAEDEREADRVTKFLAKAFRRSQFAYNVFAIGRARVPIVKFNCHGLLVDLSFKNGLPLYNTNLIKLYSDSHNIVRPFLMFIRYWAKLQGLTGGGVPNLLLTNYCLCMLMLFYLMVRKPPIVPCVGELQADLDEYVTFDGCRCNFKTDIESWRSKYHNTTLIDVALEFFQFYSDLDYDEYVISPLAGVLIPKIDVKRRKPSFAQEALKYFYEQRITLQIDTALCVQDPFDTMHNIARGYSKAALNTFRLKCKKAAEICKGIKSGIKTLSYLLEYYDIDELIEDVEDVDIESSQEENKEDESDIVSVASEDSVELLQELESLERAGGVGALLKNKEDAKSSEDSGCEVNGSSESVNSTSGNIENSTTGNKGSNEVSSEDEEIAFIGSITVKNTDKLEVVEVVNLEDSSEKVAKKVTDEETSSKNVSNGKCEDSSHVKNGSVPFIIDLDSVDDSNKNILDLDEEEDSVCVIEDIIGPGDYINPSKERFKFTINYTSNCSYDILDNGSLRPRKRGHINSSSKEKFVSDLLQFILKQVMKCNILKVETHIDGSEEYNLKNFRKRTIVKDDPPQKFLKINTEEGKAVKSDFTLLSSFECQPLYRVWEKRKKLQKEMDVLLINPLQIEMFISNKVTEDESMKLNGSNITVKLWKDSSKTNLFWISLRQEDTEEKAKNVVSVFNDLFHKITANIFSQIDEFLKWS